MKKRNVICLSALALFIGVLAPMGVYAALHANTDTLNNKFNGAYVNASVIEKGKDHEDSSNNLEDYDDLRKNGQIVVKEVSIKNIADGPQATSMYTRVRLLPSIVRDDDPNVHLGGKLSITYTFAEKTAWKELNGVYYYTKEINKGEESEILLKSVQVNQDIPEGFHIELKVVADSIVTRPQNNLSKVWKLTNGFKDLKDLPKTITI